jgi:hypothetical protein
MLAPGEHPQHARRVLTVRRLSQNRPIHHYDGIRPEHNILRTRLRHFQRLLPRQPFRTVTGTFTRQRGLIHIRGLHRKRNPGIAQKFLTSWRGRSEHKHATDSIETLQATCNISRKRF